MFVFFVKDEVFEEEFREIEMEVRKFKEESEEWIDVEDFDEILEDEE